MFIAKGLPMLIFPSHSLDLFFFVSCFGVLCLYFAFYFSYFNTSASCVAEKMAPPPLPPIPAPSFAWATFEEALKWALSELPGSTDEFSIYKFVWGEDIIMPSLRQCLTKIYWLQDLILYIEYWVREATRARTPHRGRNYKFMTSSFCCSMLNHLAVFPSVSPTLEHWLTS